MERRQFLAASGTAGLAAFAGCLTEDDGEEAEQDDPGASLPDDTQQVLGALPEAVDGDTVGNFWLVRPQAGGSERNPANQLTASIEDDLGITSAQIDLVGVALFDSYEKSVAAITGSFAASDVTAPEDTATEIRAGFAIGASTDTSPWESGLAAAVDAADDSEAGLLNSEIERLLEPVATAELVSGTLAPAESPMADEVDEDIERIAFSQSVVDEVTERVRYSVLFGEEAAVDESAVEAVMAARGHQTDSDEIEFTQDGRVLTATFTREIPSHRLPDDSPDASFSIREQGTVLEQTGTEEVDPANLELRADEEPVEGPWSDREEPIEPGEQFTVEFEPFSFVEVLWIDPEREGVEQPLGRNVVASRDAFSGEYDADTQELTVTYTGEPTVEADRLELSRYSAPDTGAGDETPLSEFVGETLATGDSFTISDLAYGDGIMVSISVEGEQFGLTQSVFSYSVDPPGTFEFEFADGTVTVVYRGDDRPTDAYRLRLNDEETDRQFTDEYDDLTDGDSIKLDAELGDTVSVVWTGNEESLPLEWYTVTPEATFEFAYDDDDTDEVEITHAGGESLDADSLTVRVFPDADINGSVWAEEYDTVSEGDSVTVSLELDGALEAVVVKFDGVTVDYREFGT